MGRQDRYMGNSTAVLPETKQVTQVVAMDSVSRLVHMHSNIDLEQMPSVFKSSGNYELPSVNEARTRNIDLGEGRVKPVPVDIGYENADRFAYKWIDEDSAENPEWRGYRIVTKDCPAAFNAQGEQLPNRVFAGRDYIARGKHLLMFAKVAYSDGQKQVGQDRVIQRMQSFAPGNTSVNISKDGNAMGAVRSTSFESLGLSDAE